MSSFRGLCQNIMTTVVSLPTSCSYQLNPPYSSWSLLSPGEAEGGEGGVKLRKCCETDDWAVTAGGTRSCAGGVRTFGCPSRSSLWKTWQNFQQSTALLDRGSRVMAAQKVCAPFSWCVPKMQGDGDGVKDRWLTVLDIFNVDIYVHAIPLLLFT